MLSWGLFWWFQVITGVHQHNNVGLFVFIICQQPLQCCPCCLAVTSGLSPPTIVSNQEEFILRPNSVFNISCTGKRSVVWDEPLPKNALVLPGYLTATLFIDNPTVENTGYYTCIYENPGSDLQGGAEEDEENEARIYVYVPGEHVSTSGTSTVCVPHCAEMCRLLIAFTECQTRHSKCSYSRIQLFILTTLCPLWNKTVSVKCDLIVDPNPVRSLT